MSHHRKNDVFKANSISSTLLNLFNYVIIVCSLLQTHLLFSNFSVLHLVSQMYQALSHLRAITHDSSSAWTALCLLFLCLANSYLSLYHNLSVTSSEILYWHPPFRIGLTLLFSLIRPCYFLLYHLSQFVLHICLVRLFV